MSTSETVYFECDVRVTDPRAVWDAARDHLLSSNVEPEQVEPHIGTRDDPNLPACVQTLLDPGSFCAGAEILGSGASME